MKVFNYKIIIIAFFLPCQLLAQTSVPASDEIILHQVADAIKNMHYSVKAFDDSFALRVFDRYMQALDRNQTIFMQNDVDDLKKYALKIDDELNGQPPVFYQQVENIFRKRIVESEGIYTALLSKPFDLDKDETFVINTNADEYPKNMQEREEKWRKYLKSQVLERMTRLHPDENGTKQIEPVARMIVKRSEEKKIDKFLHQADSDYFYSYVKEVTLAADPHSEYMTPADERIWNEWSSGKGLTICGIGIRLKEEKGTMSIRSILPGGTAEGSGKMAVGDMILGIRQANGDFEKVDGYNYQEMVDLITGREGSEVTLTCKRPNGYGYTITLKRSVLPPEPNLASSLIIQKDNRKIGYLKLPQFYAGNNSSCYADVRREIAKLKKENVQGIVMDLRYNPGGSLQDATSIAGAFIPNGPVVQVRDRRMNVEAIADMDKNMYYDGPMVIMVNAYSASAAELFTSAMQDYNRALVIGTPTFGKGTVQNIIPFASSANSGTLNDFGALRLTLRKYFRITGGSVQLKGVTPDVVVPDHRENKNDMRERNKTGALPWDQIEPADYEAWNFRYDLSAVKIRMQEKIKQDAVFQKMQQNTNQLAILNSKPLDLQWKKYYEQIKSQNTLLTASESLLHLKKKLEVHSCTGDNAQDTANLNNVSEDVYISLAADAAIELAKQIR